MLKEGDDRLVLKWNSIERCRVGRRKQYVDNGKMTKLEWEIVGHSAHIKKIQTSESSPYWYSPCEFDSCLSVHGAGRMDGIMEFSAW